jgi:hypothetical protein
MATYDFSLGNIEAHEFQPIQWRFDLDETILATTYLASIGNVEDPFKIPLGARRVENAFMGAGVYKNVKVDGRAVFRFVWNNSGADIAKGALIQRRAKQNVTDLTSGGTSYATKTANFTADKEFGGLVQVLDDAAAAGAAPEGEYAKIYKNDANTIYFQPDLSAALVVSDDLDIIYHSHVVAGAAGATPADSPMVAVVAIPNGYMGWACEQADAVEANVVAAGTAITVGKGLIAGTSLLTNGSSSALSLILAYALFALSTDTVARKLMVKFGVGSLGASA